MPTSATGEDSVNEGSFTAVSIAYGLLRSDRRPRCWRAGVSQLG